MKYSQIFAGIETAEQERRLKVVEKINILGDRRNACLSESDRKVFDKKIRKIARQETSWMKEYAWFLY